MHSARLRSYNFVLNELFIAQNSLTAEPRLSGSFRQHLTGFVSIDGAFQQLLIYYFDQIATLDRPWCVAPGQFDIVEIYRHASALQNLGRIA